MKDRTTSQLRFAFDEPPALQPEAVFVRNARARRYVLRLLRDGTPRVTIPRRGSRREAEAFLASQADWVARERARLFARFEGRGPQVWADGHAVLIGGRPVTLRRGHGHPPGVHRDGDTLVVVPPPDRPADFKGLVCGWLWDLARRELPARLHALANAFGLEVAAVSIRNQRSRWGSCATSGRISLNWRLVQTPDDVRDYVLVHELMHLRQPNHSRRFWQLVAQACPDFETARRWLRQHEALLLD
ncbi:MAG TPA: SprT family zinc-dependent metalloprotease [Vicinamibacterales bacterium]